MNLATRTLRWMHMHMSSQIWVLKRERLMLWLYSTILMNRYYNQWVICTSTSWLCYLWNVDLNFSKCTRLIWATREFIGVQAIWTAKMRLLTKPLPTDLWRFIECRALITTPLFVSNFYIRIRNQNWWWIYQIYHNYLSTRFIKSRCCLGHPSLSSQSLMRDTGVHMVIVRLHTGFLSSCLGYECLSTARSRQFSFEIFWTPPKPANAPNVQNHSKACGLGVGTSKSSCNFGRWIGLGIV